jgi:hypothetical protein
MYTTGKLKDNRPYSIKRTNRLCLLVLFTLTLGMAGCSDDEEAPRHAPGQTMQLQVGFSNYVESPWSQTRAGLPTGFETYVPYESLYPQTQPQYASIAANLIDVTDANEPPKNNLGTFTYNLIKNWPSEIPVLENHQYYLYGLMPSDESVALGSTSSSEWNVAPTVPGISYAPYSDNNYSTGVEMTVNKLNAVTPADVCVIVGVKKGKAGTSIDDAEDLLPGHFNYLGSAEDDETYGGNYAYVLLDHIYAGIHFKMKVDTEYAKLRTIRLQKIVLRAHNEVKTVKAVIRIKAGTPAEGGSPIEEVTFTPNETGVTTSDATLYEAKDTNGNETLDKDELNKLNTSFQDFLACFTPGSCTVFDLISTYNVYDRKDNLIRENQVSENRITLTGHLARGQINTFLITVKPTYLYMLSDPDLDNPTITIQ